MVGDVKSKFRHLEAAYVEGLDVVIGIETSNLYTGFLALANNLLCEDGKLVAICPRSFCNGP